MDVYFILIWIMYTYLIEASTINFLSIFIQLVYEATPWKCQNQNVSASRLLLLKMRKIDKEKTYSEIWAFYLAVLLIYCL